MQQMSLVTTWNFFREDLWQLYIFLRKITFSRMVMCVEGFPRSANTFLTHVLLQLGHPLETMIHHSHNPLAVLWSVLHGLPALVPFRDPGDAVVSFVIYHGEEDVVAIDNALERWRYFYHCMRLPWFRNRISLIPFDCVSTDVRGAFRRYAQFLEVPETGLSQEEFQAISWSYAAAQFEHEKRPEREFPLPKPEFEKKQRELRCLVQSRPLYHLAMHDYGLLASGLKEQ